MYCVFFKTLHATLNRRAYFSIGTGYTNPLCIPILLRTAKTFIPHPRDIYVFLRLEFILLYILFDLLSYTVCSPAIEIDYIILIDVCTFVILRYESYLGFEIVLKTISDY